MKQKLLHRLRSTLEFMSSAERKIARAVLADPERFTGYSLGELSRIACVAQGSIINFSKKYCGGGFPELKMAVAKSLAEQGEMPFSTAEDAESVSAILGNTVSDIGIALENTVALNGNDALESAVEMLLSAKKIEIYGIFRSAVVATDIYYQLIQLGLSANFVSDVLTCAMSASMLDKSSLVVAVSGSGQTQDVIDAVRLAKVNDVPILAITAHRESPLAKLADVTLIAAPSGNSVSTHATEIRASQLAIVDTLCIALRKKIEGSDRRYTKMSEILRSHNVKD